MMNYSFFFGDCRILRFTNGNGSKFVCICAYKFMVGFTSTFLVGHGVSLCLTQQKTFLPLIRSLIREVKGVCMGRQKRERRGVWEVTSILH